MNDNELNITVDDNELDSVNDLGIIDKNKIYTISIITDDDIQSICLNDFSKEKITFGRSDDNDIILNSPIVSGYHGYFSLENGSVRIFDNKSTNGIFINNSKIISSSSLSDGDTIKIDNPMSPLVQGVLIVISEGTGKNNWTEFDVTEKNVVTIGRSKFCDIVLERVSISSKHAKIMKRDDGYYIESLDSDGGVILNNTTLTDPALLRDKDVILINNVRLIYNQGKVLYQLYDYGVRLDAIDVVKTVRVKWKKKDIANHLDFTASPGEFISFVGESGAGKSIFLKCISGVVKPTKGKVFINGNDLYKNYGALKKLIGYVPQENIIYDDLKLIDMLRYSANLRMPDDSSKKEKEKRINEVLDIVELSDKKDVMIRNLSGGQQKRACIAVELIADPKLFFLDEPTSGLDPGTERSLMKVLRKMANSGKTIILITHNTLNLHLCDKVVFFGPGGNICFDGKPEAALEFFKVDDFVDVYNVLAEESDEWHNKFAQSKYKKAVEVDNSEKVSIQRNRPKSFFKQFFTLLRRDFKTLFNNKQQMLMLFGQVILVAFLFTLVFTDDLFYYYEETRVVLFAIVIASIWLGLLNSIQEVCSEKVILHKEYMADLRLLAYIISKVVYLMIIAFIQAFSLIGMFALVIDVPQMGVMSSWMVETILITFLTIFSSSTIGLVVSSLSKDTSVALTMPTLLMVPQILFSGVLFPLNGVIMTCSKFALSRWALEALGTTNDLNSLISIITKTVPGYVREVESFYIFTINHFNFDLSIILLMTVALIMSSYFILKIQLESGR